MGWPVLELLSDFWLIDGDPYKIPFIQIPGHKIILENVVGTI
jgi:hypothetical protein